MSKGLGRGLSSLFAVYDNKKEEKVVKNNQKINEEQQNVLSNADQLIEKYQKKSIIEKNDDSNFLKEKAVVEKRLEIAGENVYGNNSRQIPISSIITNPDQPRKNFDQEALRELAQSIKEHGIIQPIILVKRDDNYLIIAGERRYRAAKIAGLKSVPAIVRDYTEQEIKEIALIENLQREDLNPIETAIAIKQLIDNYGFTQDQVAEKIGKSRPVVANSLRLLTLEPEVLTLVEKGKLAPGIARAIISLPRDEQITLAKKASDGKMTARDVEKSVQDITKPEEILSKKSAPLSAELISLKDEMQQVFGTKITILGNNKKGRIYFDYYNTDDLDRIYTLIHKIK